MIKKANVMIENVMNRERSLLNFPGPPGGGVGRLPWGGSPCGGLLCRLLSGSGIDIL